MECSNFRIKNFVKCMDILSEFSFPVKGLGSAVPAKISEGRHEKNALSLKNRAFEASKQLSDIVVHDKDHEQHQQHQAHEMNHTFFLRIHPFAPYRLDDQKYKPAPVQRG